MKKKNDLCIHPTSIIGKNVSLGKGTYIGPQATIHDNVSIGEHCNIGPRVTIGEPGPQYYSSDDYEFPPTYIGENSIIRSGTVIYNGCRFGQYLRTGHYAVIRENTIAGDHCSFGTYANIDGDCELGNYVRIHYLAHVCKKAKIGNYVWIYPYSLLTNDIHPPCNMCMDGPTIEDYAVVTVHCVVMPRVRIGKHALVAANSVVTCDVPANTIVAGTPAKERGLVSDIRCDFEGLVETPYPWPTHLKQGYPWENTTWDDSEDSTK